MKKSIVYVLAIACLLTGCNFVEPTAEDEGDCLVSFNMVGEITTSETPMTKASSSDIYLVQVYRESEPFASGAYDNPEEIKVNLKKGNQKYRIIISILKNGKQLLEENYSELNNSVQVQPYTIYVAGSNNNAGYISDNGSVETLAWGQAVNRNICLAMNYMYYNCVDIYKYYDNKVSTQLKEGSRQTTYLTTWFNITNNYYPYFKNIETASINSPYPQCDDWFYGEINNYSPNGSFEILPIEVKRVGFKLKYELSGVTDGEVTVSVNNDTKTFINNTTTTSTYSSTPVFYAFYDVHSAWQYAGDYTENMTLAVSWLRGIGITEDYGTKTIQIKRNCLNNIKISLGINDQNAGMTMTVEAESTIGAEGVTIPVQ